MAKKERSIVWYDANNIQAEWEGQPELAFELGQDFAEKQYEYDCCKVDVEKAEEDLKKAEAELLIDVKRNFASHGFEKDPPMELAKASVVASNQYQKCLSRVFKVKDKMNDTKREMAIAYAAVQACKDRKSALEKQVDLMWLSGATPRARTPEAAEHARARATERATAKVKYERNSRGEDD